ncbi:hypothetical protein D3C71_2153360 [compost metagenome]
MLDARCERIADLHASYSLAQHVAETIEDAGLHEDAVGANTRLPRVAKLYRQQTRQRGVQIRIVEHDESSVAAQF